MTIIYHPFIHLEIKFCFFEIFFQIKYNVLDKDKITPLIHGSIIVSKGIGKNNGNRGVKTGAVSPYLEENEDWPTEVTATGYLANYRVGEIKCN